MGRFMCHYFCFLISLFQCPYTFSSSPPSFNSFSTRLCSRDDYIALLQFKNTVNTSGSGNGDCDPYDSSVIQGRGCLSLCACATYPRAGPADISYPKTDYWKEGTDCCSWDGVTCDNITGHVIGLDLSCSRLIGTTLHPNSSLFLLRHLEKLNLAYNDFNISPIPPQINRLTSLTHLNLTTSSFGRIPSELSHLSKLVSLDLSWNYEIETEKHDFESLVQNLTSLRELNLGGINLSSVDPYYLKNLSPSLTSLLLFGCGIRGKLPENIFRLPYLNELDLSGNEELYYYFPRVNWTSPLKILDLSSTRLIGKLGNSIGNLKNLTYLDLKQNNIYGSLPSSLGNLTKIVHLDISYNNFSDKIPYPSFVNINYLDLSHNNLSGEIPSSLFGNLLKYIDLSYNHLIGQIPSSITKTRLVFLNLSYNKLAGSIPSDITWRPNLTDLVLNDNELNGTLPSWFYHLSSLVNLDLSSNKLTGQINEFRCRTFTHIDLSNNDFQGLIPKSIFELVDLFDLDLSSNNFSGRINFEMFSKLKNLDTLHLSSNNLSIITDNFINNSALPRLSVLRLGSCNLREFPSFFITLKSSLEVLDLSNNKIGGLIPNDMGMIMRLNLSSNLLEGFEQSPDGYSFIGMDLVDLHSNKLQGSLPSIFEYMGFFSAANNMLSGALPPSICYMTDLRVLNLSNNLFNGSIPTCLGNLTSIIPVLNLGRNRFTGSIPPLTGSMAPFFKSGCLLRSFDVSENQLQGSIPRSLAHCKNLEVLNLGKNYLVDTFPFWLDSLPKLQVLILKSNRLHGPILQHQQKRTSAFRKLNIIDLSYNNFSGTMPSEFFERFNSMAAITDSKSQVVYISSTYYYDSVTLVIKRKDTRYERILTIFKAVDFSNNHFEGEIPKSVGNLKSLLALNFSGNGFTGPIPSSFGNLRELESLDLSKNKLSGEIPRQLTSLTFLSVFDVSQNHLVGTIPRGRQFETFSNTSYEKNSGLCGPPLSKKCGNDEEEPSPPPHSTSEESQSSYKFGRNVYDWIVVVLGYAGGLVIGLVGGNLIFDKKKAWFMKIFDVGRRHQRKVMNKNRRNRVGR